MIILTESNDPISKLRGRGLEILSMNLGDHHSAWFFDGLLCGFTWKDIQKNHNVIHDSNNVFQPERNRAAQMFLTLYGAQGQDLLDKALSVAQEE
jgi:hypothetical protein